MPRLTAQKEFEVACDEYQLGDKFLMLDGLIEEAKRQEAASQALQRQPASQDNQMCVSSG